MHFIVEHLVEAVLAAGIIVVFATGLLIAFVILRRRKREEYFHRLDKLRARCSPIIVDVLDGTVDYHAGLEAIKQACQPLDSSILERMLVAERDPAEAEVGVLRRLCEDLGLVSLWQQRLAGETDKSPSGSLSAGPSDLSAWFDSLRFVQRAESAHYLGKIRHRPSWRLLVRAMDDPHLDVRLVAARSLEAIQEPQSFVALAGRLQVAVLSSSAALPVRHIKAALASFPLERSTDLAPSLRHPDPRVRYCATDVIRCMVEREADATPERLLRPGIFAPGLADLFLMALATDACPEVRVRAVPVIARLADAKALRALLALLEDREWFVRLYAVRAVAGRRDALRLDSLVPRLTDSNWRVREAATRALLESGQRGQDLLLEHFLNTGDRYSREQIAESLERSGMIPSLLEHYGNQGYEQETRVIERLTSTGRMSALHAALDNGLNSRQKRRLLDYLRCHAEPGVRALAREFARDEASDEVTSLAATAERVRGLC